MAWTTPITWATNQLVAAADMNAQVRDNLNFLYNRFPLTQVARKGVTDYTTTSTSFVDVDAANLIITLTPVTGKVVVFAMLSYTNSANADTWFDLILDSTTRLGSTNGSIVVSNGLTGALTVAGEFTGLSNASHTFKLQWKVSSGTGTVRGAASVAMLAWEVN